MGARDLLTELAGAGLSITVDGGNLVIRPRDLLTDELRAAVKAAKPELVDLLTWEPPAGAELWTAPRPRCRRRPGQLHRVPQLPRRRLLQPLRRWPTDHCHQP